jgi:hypothetical protein
MRLKQFSIVWIFILALFLCNAQQRPGFKTEKSFLFSPGLISQSNIFADLNLTYGVITMVNEPKVPPIFGVSGYRIGFESNFRSGNNYIIAPKVGYEYSLLVLVARISAVNYFQNKNSEFRLLPEIGITFLGEINLTYGFGIRFNQGNIDGLSKHRIGISINLNRKLNKGVRELI